MLIKAETVLVLRKTKQKKSYANARHDLPIYAMCMLKGYHGEEMLMLGKRVCLPYHYGNNGDFQGKISRCGQLHMNNISHKKVAYVSFQDISYILHLISLTRQKVV